MRAGPQVIREVAVRGAAGGPRGPFLSACRGCFPVPFFSVSHHPALKVDAFIGSTQHSRVNRARVLGPEDGHGEPER